MTNQEQKIIELEVEIDVLKIQLERQTNINNKQAKQLDLHVVSQQRELLLLFKKWEQEVYYKPYDGDAELTVDTYLKSNCG